MPTMEMAKKIDSSAITISNRIKKLKEKGVIKGFKINVDFPKLGYHFYKADIFLKDPKKYSSIFKCIEANPNLNHILKSVGYVDLELLFYLKSVNQLHEIMEELSVKFPNAIKNYTYFKVIKTHKWNYMPDV
jgi:Lrp/AsnC family transcriptional regulator for asnA, asnC and gidA